MQKLPKEKENKRPAGRKLSLQPLCQAGFCFSGQDLGPGFASEEQALGQSWRLISSRLPDAFSLPNLNHMIDKRKSRRWPATWTNTPRPAPLAPCVQQRGQRLRSAYFGGAEPVSDPPWAGGCAELSLGGGEAGALGDGAIGDAASGDGFVVDPEVEG
ncbi:MAG TPA: hypothetical protein VEP67_03925 [Thiobacillaceae bacterium]|nr:hypothetical protein [Thiobacillaceae bacterium]